MSQAYIGEIRCFGFNFAPYQWALCNGQPMAISQYTALFSILGTTYGGNGTTTFNLPNLQGQIPMHWGSNAPGVPNTVIGEVQGTPTVTLTSQQIPSHTHTATGAEATQKSQRSAAPNTSGTSFIASSESPDFAWQSAPTPNTPFAANAISVQGGSLPHENMQPFQVLNFCISLYGEFPTRS